MDAGHYDLVPDDLANLVLLAENRLSLPTANRVTALRIGFFAQTLLISGWFLTYQRAPGTESAAIAFFGMIGGMHLAAVAMFTVTEDLIVPRRAAADAAAVALALAAGGLRPRRRTRRGLRAGEYGRLSCRGLIFDPPALRLRWLVAICAYICLFTGVPTLVFRVVKPARPASVPLRAGLLLLLSLALLLPDILYYLLWP